MTKSRNTTKKSSASKKGGGKTSSAKSKAIKKTKKGTKRVPSKKRSSQFKGLRTTVIGSYPKPSYLKIPDWFKMGASTGDELVAYQAFMAK